MTIIGTVSSLWRFPVKGMRGEEVELAHVGYAGIYGDRLFAIRNSESPKGFPYLTAREQRKLLQCRPRFRHPDRAALPSNFAEAEKMGPGLTPLSPDVADLMVDVVTPEGETLAIDDPELNRFLGDGVSGAPRLSLLRSDRALTDCRPVSLISLQSIEQLATEIGIDIDPRRFRMNLYLDLPASKGFAEDDFIGRSLRIGSKAMISVLERDPRCVMISLDPDSGESQPEVLKQVAQAHDGKIGVYAAVLVEGAVRKGDTVELLD